MKVAIQLFSILFLFGTSQQQDGFVSDVVQNFDEKVNNHLEQQVTSFYKQELAYKAYATYFDRADVDLPGFKKLFAKMAERARSNADSTTDHIIRRGGRLRFPVVQLQHVCDDIDNELRKLEITKMVKLEHITKRPRVSPNICLFQSVVRNLDKSLKVKKPQKSTKKSGLFGWFSSERSQSSSHPHTISFIRDDWQSGLSGVEDALALEKHINQGLLDLTKEAIGFGDPHTKLRMEELMEDQVKTIKELADLVTRLQQANFEDYPLTEYLIDTELS